MKVLAILLLVCCVTNARPQKQSHLAPDRAYNQNNRQTFYIPPDQQQPSAANQQQLLTQPPIQLQIPIPNDGVQEKKIYVQLPAQQYPQQQPQYRYPPRKHYKIILVRSPPQPTSPPAPVLPDIEEQTLVYVLVKKQDSPSASDLEQLQQQQLQQQQQSFKLNKPEVYFIKYKANEQGALTAIPSNAIEKSIEQKLGNNLNGDSGYTYDSTRKREAKNLIHDETVTAAEDIVQRQ